MDWAYLFEISLTGVAGGGLYALAALAFVLVYKATRVVNIAIGEMLMIGAYLFFAFAASFALPLWLAILGAVLGTGLLGAVIERTMIRPLLGEPPISVFMVTVGLASILVGLVEIVWTADQRRLPEFFPNTPIMVGDAFLAPKVAYGALVATFLIALVLLLFRFWRGGVALRATASDQGAAYMMGNRARTQLWLSQDDTARIGRVLTEYDYVNRARADQVAQVQAEIDRIAQLQVELEQQRVPLPRDDALPRRQPCVGRSRALARERVEHCGDPMADQPAPHLMAPRPVEGLLEPDDRVIQSCHRATSGRPGM